MGLNPAVTTKRYFLCLSVSSPLKWGAHSRACEPKVVLRITQDPCLAFRMVSGAKPVLTESSRINITITAVRAVCRQQLCFVRSCTPGV